MWPKFRYDTSLKIRVSVNSYVYLGLNSHKGNKFFIWGNHIISTLKLIMARNIFCEAANEGKNDS